MKNNYISEYKGIKVLLIDGGSRQVLPLMKGFFKLGCDVYTYCSSKLDVGYVYKYKKESIIDIFDINDKEKTYNSILKVIRQYKIDLVIPLNDFAAVILANNKKELSQYSTIYVNDLETFILAYDKLNTMKICIENDIPCPKTIVFESIDNINIDDLDFPLIIKPRSSYGANGLSIVYEKDKLVDVFNATEEKFGKSLIQELVKKGGKQYQVELLIGKDNECKFCLIMEKVRWYPLDGGSSTLDITIHNNLIKNNCIKLLKLMDWKGYATLDLIEDPLTGNIKILEINPRINGTAKLCFHVGIDLSKMILDDVYNKKITCCDYADGKILKYFHLDFLWFLKSKDRFKTKPSWFSNKNTVDEIFEFGDLRPACVYSLTSIKKLFTDKKKRKV